LLLISLAGPLRAAAPDAAATFAIEDAELPTPLVLVAYGDMRFTSPAETGASNRAARRALVGKIAALNPAAVFINGDIVWHGIADDYAVYREETRAWRDRHIRVYPALGNHEFYACTEQACLGRWWDTFPELRGRRWYSVAIGSKVVSIELDTDASLLPGSEQRRWLESQVAALGDAVRVVMVVLHHPPVADVQTGPLADHNPRPNEMALAEYLRAAAARSAARFIVSAGHIHNYERIAADGVMYLVSGGGGAAPYEVARSAADLFQQPEFPNYHFVRFEIGTDRIVGEMIRLRDYADHDPKQWDIRDRFEIILRP
jgi:acid phosphatase type 7